MHKNLVALWLISIEVTLEKRLLGLNEPDSDGCGKGAGLKFSQYHPIMTTHNNSNLVICQDLSYKGPGRMCVVLDPTRQSITFENCFISKAFLSVGGEALFECRFHEITKVTDFLVGDSKGTLFRSLIFLHAKGTSDLRSIFVYTKNGNARIFADWNGFEALRSTLLEKCKPARGGGYGIDNPNMAVVYAFIFVLLLTGLIWILL